jgi:uncharacterized protein YndB with AHSA1/START domain
VVVIRFLLRVTLIGGALGWVLDRMLAARQGMRPADPIRSMVVIDAPIQRVWATLADVEGQPRWMRDLKSVRLLTPGPVGVGTRAEGEIRIFGIGVLDPITITAFDPPRRFAIRHEGQFNGEGVMELEPGADGTTTIVRWHETIVPPYLPQLGALVLGPVLGRIFQDDLHELRELVEASPEP